MVVPRGREVVLDEATASLRVRVLETLDRSGFQPPPVGALREDLAVAGDALQGVLDLLVDEGAVVHLGGELFMAAGPHGAAREAVVDNCERNGQLEIPELRDRLGTTRKYLIPLLEHFDSVGLTARRGGSRVLKKR